MTLLLYKSCKIASADNFYSRNLLDGSTCCWFYPLLIYLSIAPLTPYVALPFPTPPRFCQPLWTFFILQLHPFCWLTFSFLCVLSLFIYFFFLVCGLYFSLPFFFFFLVKIFLDIPGTSNNIFFPHQVRRIWRGLPDIFHVNGKSVKCIGYNVLICLMCWRA